MKTVYLDEAFLCHAENAEGRRAVETEVFDETPESALPCFRFVPPGESYEDSVCPDGWIQCLDSEKVRACYEQQRITELSAQNEALINDMAQLVEEVYQSDLEMMTE